MRTFSPWRAKYLSTTPRSDAPRGKVDLYEVRDQDGTGQTMATISVPFGEFPTAHMICDAVNQVNSPTWLALNVSLSRYRLAVVILVGIIAGPILWHIVHWR